MEVFEALVLKVWSAMVISDDGVTLQHVNGGERRVFAEEMGYRCAGDNVDDGGKERHEGRRRRRERRHGRSYGGGLMVKYSLKVYEKTKN